MLIYPECIHKEFLQARAHAAFEQPEVKVLEDNVVDQEDHELLPLRPEELTKLHIIYYNTFKLQNLYFDMSL